MILPQQFLNPKIKPKWWGSLGVVGSAIAYNCRIHGFPMPMLAVPYWEGAGNKVYDLSGNKNHLTLQNAIPWTASPYGLCTDLEQASDHYISLTNPITVADNTGWTYACLIFVESFTESFIPLYGNNFVTGERTRAFFSYDYFTLYNDADAGALTAISFSAGYWYLLILTGTGTNFFLWKNGSKITLNMPADTSQTIRKLGSLGSPTAYTMDGKIAFSAFWNSYLTDNQARFLTNNPYFMFQPIPVPYVYAGAPPAASPTSVLYGPLHGPFAGPI